MEDDILHMHGTGHEPEPYQHGPFPGDHPWTFPTFAAFAHHCAEHCDDQLPLFSQVGRGLQGDGYLVRISSDSERETILEGLTYDPHTGAYTHDWYSENINGGKLNYQITFYPNTDPKTFKIKFYLDRPNRPEWEMETPLIPYIWESQADLPAGGVATLFTKPKTGETWTEKLVLPDGHTRDEYNLPDQGEPWTVNLTYGIGGDIDCPTTDEFKDHLHKDLYNNKYDNIPSDLKPLNGDGGNASVWDWILYARDYLTFTEGTGIDITETTANGHRNIDIAADLQDVLTHLHEDLYGKGVSGHDYTQQITRLGLMPLGGDGGTKSVWDWIRYVLDNITDPEMKTLSVNTWSDHSIWLVLIKPTNSATNGIPTTISSYLAAIHATVDIQYYDVLPTVSIAVTPVNEAPIGNAPYTKEWDAANSQWQDVNGVRFGTGEILVVCEDYGSGNSHDFRPLDFSRIELDREFSNKLKYPQLNPEVITNVGFGWVCLESRFIAGSNAEYPGDSTGIYTHAELTTGGSVYGNWEVYTGFGNIGKKSSDVDPREGGWPWIKKGEDNNKMFGYLFNRSTYTVGPRVRIDYARTYSLTYN